MRLIKYISFLIVVFSAGQTFSQTSWTGKAYEAYKANDYNNAQIAIDSAIKTNERYDSQTWQLRGIIYRNVTKGDSLFNRKIALESFVQAKDIDSLGLYRAQIDGYIKNTVIRYFNDAVTWLLVEKEFEKSLDSYETYKNHYVTLIDPNHDFTEADINYYNAVGVEYMTKATVVSTKEKDDLRDKALLFCHKALDLDTTAYTANFNIAIIHYNTGADFIMDQPAEITIEQLILSQQKAADAFLKALPYAHRAEKIKPNSKELHEALMGCYYGLNNNERYIHYQTLVDKKNIAFYEEQYRKDPKDKKNIKELIRVYSFTIVNPEKEKFYRKALQELPQ
ncbi:hypothetical protein [Crocinitomix algicola]|uniref:hypothetical protein n=1 Tax=Crocinitomix algicola TaxID=1740263 RepID=UPI00082C47CA|nr:hypothetical protein [Crocinitomix algicola]